MATQDKLYKAKKNSCLVLDPETGEPTGILKEAAQSLLKIWDQPKPEEDIARALKAHAILVKCAQQFGGVVYPPVYFHAGFDQKHLVPVLTELFQRLKKRL